MNLKLISKILYCIGIPFFSTAIIIAGLSTYFSWSTTQIVFICLSFTGAILIAIAFFIDFRQTMILKETAGDKFTLMSKAKLISILDKHEIEYEEGKGREYYLFLVRENFE